MKIKRSELIELAKKHIGNDSLESQNQIMMKICVARAARLSYMTFDGDIDYEADIKLHDRLLESRHASPFEHVARAVSDEEYYSNVKGEFEAFGNGYDFVINEALYKDQAGWFDNFKGFQSYRHILENQ